MEPFWAGYIAKAELILQPFRHFTYVKTHYPALPSLYLRHNSFSNPSVASPTSQFILQPFFRFSYVTSTSLNSPGEPPMMKEESRVITVFKGAKGDWDIRICDLVKNPDGTDI